MGCQSFPSEPALGALGKVRQTVLDVKVVIQGTEGVSIKLLERYGTMSKPNGLEVILGSLISEAKRKLVFVVTLPSREEGSEIPLVIQAEYKSAGEEQMRQTDEDSLGIELARRADNAVIRGILSLLTSLLSTGKPRSSTTVSSSIGIGPIVRKLNTRRGSSIFCSDSERDCWYRNHSERTWICR